MPGTRRAALRYKTVVTTEPAGAVSFRERCAHLVRAALLVAALSGALFHLVADWAPRAKGSIPNFTAFACGIDAYRAEMRPAWKPRVAATWLADATVRRGAPASDVAEGGALEAETSKRIAGWTAVWFAATLVVVLLTFPFAEFVALGVFAAVVWGYAMPVAGFRVFPWDMPALFFSALVFGLHRRGVRAGLVPLLVLAVAFKESLTVWGLVLLYDEAPLRVRLQRAVAVFAGGALVHAAIDHWVASPRVVFTQETSAAGRVLFVENLKQLGFRATRFGDPGLLETPWLMNGGFLLPFLVLPGTRELRPWKIVSLVFVASLLAFGILTEYRIYFELAPVAVVAAAAAAFGPRGSPPPPPRPA